MTAETAFRVCMSTIVLCAVVVTLWVAIARYLRRPRKQICRDDVRVIRVTIVVRANRVETACDFFHDEMPVGSVVLNDLVDTVSDDEWTQYKHRMGIDDRPKLPDNTCVVP